MKRNPVSSTFRCGHPRNRANTVLRYKNAEICRTCNNARTAKWRAEQRAQFHLPPERVTPKLDLSTDDAVRLFRLEKAKRADRKRPEMDAARRMFEAALAADREAKKGGRPRKIVGSDLSEVRSA